MDAHVGRVTRSCFYQLRQIRTIRQSLSDNATRTLIHSFVVTRVDYCNSVLSGITAVQTERVQRILNAAARLVLRIPKFAPESALIIDSLHWLPAAQRIKFKILVLVANCINQRAPLYLQERCVLALAVPGRRHLRSADQLCLVVNRCRLSSMQKRGFAVAGPAAWNDKCKYKCKCTTHLLSAPQPSHRGRPDTPAATRVLIAMNSNRSKIVIKTHLFSTVMNDDSEQFQNSPYRALEKTLKGALTK